jgi:hypothetical protein
MLRLLGIFGFTGGFLVISPALRQTVLEWANAAALFAGQHSPYSYIGVAILIFGTMTVALLSGQTSR